jgi:DNA-directed RNA polymerase specialized sigma subunit
MNIDLIVVVIIILLSTGCLSLINTTNSYENSPLKMFILTTIQSSPSLINHYLRRRSSVHLTHTTLNLTNDSIKNNITLSTNKLRSLDVSHVYHVIKDGSSKYKINEKDRLIRQKILLDLTKTQIKVIITAVIIISFIMLIMAIFRFK